MIPFKSLCTLNLNKLWEKFENNSFNVLLISFNILGYLKNENCTSAVAEYLSTSPVLKDVPRKEFIITRVFDRTLVDILMEYAEIYTISK